MSRPSLVVGASGQVGGALYRQLRARGRDVVGTGRTRAGGDLRPLEIAEPSQVEALVEHVRPGVIYAPVALAAVDYCEAHPDEAYRFNVAPFLHLGPLARRLDTLVVYYSTDYVFDGVRGHYREDDPISPTSVYGRTKAEGEAALRDSGARHLILRTAVVYGWDHSSVNFAMQVWQRLGQGERMRVPNDQVGNPTLVDFLADASIRLVDMGAEGIVNTVGRDAVPRSELAFRLADLFGFGRDLIEPVPTAALNQPARRPLNAQLVTDRIAALLGEPAIGLDEALARLRRQWQAETNGQPTRTGASA